MNKPRILLYSHDTFGLGHLRRSLLVAGQIANDIPGAHQLLITGSMVAGAFGLPPRLDMIKLPALSKRTSGEYRARVLPLSLKRTLAWREEMILQAAMHFRPHLVLVDKAASGVHGELIPTLRWLRVWSPDTRIVLGMRDIEDSPSATRAEWMLNGVPELFEGTYDAILFYGERAVFDPVTAYGMSPAAAAKLIECGYLRRMQAARSPTTVRRELGIGDQPLVVVTVGGGGDGFPVVKNFLEMLAAQPQPYASVVVTGPLMARAQRVQVHRLARQTPAIMLEFTPDLFSYLAAADLVVGMAGYNTVCELLSLGQRALLVPRAHVREEQRLRALGLAQRGLARVLLPEELTPDRLSAEITLALAQPRPAVTLNLDGLPRAAAALACLLSAAACPPVDAPDATWLQRSRLAETLAD